jgi:signal transduction histidine kinase
MSDERDDDPGRKAGRRDGESADRERDRAERELERLKRALDREHVRAERAHDRIERESERAERERDYERAERDRGQGRSTERSERDQVGGERDQERSERDAGGDRAARLLDWERRAERRWAWIEPAWRREASQRQRWEARRGRRGTRAKRRAERWKQIDDERAMWMRMGRDQRMWGPWWLQARMRRRIFSWMALAFVAGAIGMHFWSELHWWHAVVAMVVLSVISGMISFRLTRPLIMVIRVAQDIGDGKLDTRLDVDRHRGETRLLAIAINEMAERIQQQVVDQRQLLAAVSHELRTPLGHMRVLIDTARAAGDGKALGELESEVLMLDDLVGRLLASSRLEFGNLDRRLIDLGPLISDAATAAGVAPEAIEAIGDVRASVDPTLVRRALGNLLDNARVHGGGAVAVRIERRAAQVAIEVDDAGPGLTADRRADAFRAFVPSRAGGLGLGLALVSRIAVAHGGGAWITDRPGGGARVGFTVAVAPPVDAGDTGDAA